jgi:hypothetical protein
METRVRGILSTVGTPAIAGTPAAGTLATEGTPERLETLKAGRTSTAVRTTATAEILASARFQGR